MGTLFFLSLNVLSSCGAEPSASSTAAGNTIKVVAAENFWGSIAAQLGGTHVEVSSIVSSPNGDPHEYESTTGDARTVAQARYVILNGAGYDDWGKKLLDANPVEGRKVLSVADLIGKRAGDNPHFWYSPLYVEQVAKQITADYKALDAANAAYFDQQYVAFQNALKPYKEMIASLKTRYAGARIGISESIFIYMAQALDLNVITPQAYYNAEANGTEPPAEAVAVFNRQIASREVQVFVLNVQTVDNTVRNLQQVVQQQHIPVVEISETVRPANGKFQDWQLAQLTALRDALSRASAG